MSFTRREFIRTAGMGAAALSIPGWMKLPAKQGEKPNILFIMSDDHAERAISCYNDTLIQTPNIDRIAKEGIRFENSFVTNSICAPSRAAMLTGKYSHKNGLRDNRDEFDGSQFTFPKELQKEGYHTSIVGKWHLKTTPTGFDNWQILRGQGQYYNPDFIENGEETHYTGYTTDIITDKALEVLNGIDKNEPFCMLVHHKAPHRNFMPAPEYLDKFEDREFPLPESFYDNYKTREKTAGQADMRIDDMYLSFDLKLKEWAYEKETGTGGNKRWAKNVEDTWEATYNRLTPEQKKKWDAYYNKINREFKEANLSGKELLEWKYQRYIKDYLRSVLSVDDSVGKLLDYLDKKGLAENTIVVYTSDQGFYLGEHGWYDKRFMYEESFGMPLVMRYPAAVKAGQVNNALVMNIDFAPTFLDYAGANIPDEIQGKSLRKLIKGTSDWREAVYYHYYEYPHGWHNVRKHYGIRTDRYKLIHFYGNEDIMELYDLKEDPGELINVYDNPRYADIKKELGKELEKLREEYGDTGTED